MAIAPSGIDLGNGVLADLVRINCRYLLEWRNGGTLYRALSLPLPPQSLSIQSPAPHVVTYTLGKRPVREFGEVRKRTVELNGSSGYDVRIGYTRKGAITSALGPVLLNEFRLFLEDYQKAATSEGDQHTLTFRALDEGYHLLVEPQEITISRDAGQNHFDHAWSLMLDAYDDAEAERPFDDIQSKIDQVTSAIQTAADYVALAGAVVNGSNEFARLFLAPFTALQNLTGALSELSEGIQSILDIPSDLLKQLSNVALDIRQTGARLINDIERFPDSVSQNFVNLMRIVGFAEVIQHEAEAAQIYAPRATITETVTNTPVLLEQSTQAQNTGSTVYRLRLGENLRTLAQRIFNDSELWYELRELNGWLDAERLPSGRPAAAGDIILIPATIENDNSQRLDDPYGTDLKVQSGDLVLKGGDLSLVNNYQNLEQAIRHRLHTIKNETIILKDYGLPEQIGRRINSQSAGLLAAYIREQLVRDTRIESVPVIELFDKGDQLQANLEITPNNGALLNFETKIG